MKKSAIFALGLSLLLSCVAEGVGAVDTTGETVTLTAGTVKTSDGITGTGTLTITTAGATVNDASTFGTYQFIPNADFTGFTGGIALTNGIVDLNANNLTVTGVTFQNTDTTSSIINTGAAQSVLTMSGGSSIYGRVGNADGTNSNIKVIFGGTSTRNFFSRMYNTGGTTVEGGSLGLQAASNTEAENMLGNGPISLTNTTINAQQGRTYTFSNDIAAVGNLNLRMQSGSTMNFSGALTGTGNILIPHDGGQVIFSGSAKTYTGKTVIGTTSNAWADSRAIAMLRIDADNLIPTGTTLEMGGSYGGSVLNLNGHQQTVAKLSGTGTLNNTAGTASVLTVSSALCGVMMNVNANTTLKTTAVGEHVLSTSGVGTVEVAGGTISTHGLVAANMKLGGDTTISNIPALWGKSVYSGASDFTSPSNPSKYKADTSELNTNSTGNNTGTFPYNTTMAFEGLFEVTEATQLSFMKNFDDSGYVWVTPVNEDGTLGTKQIVIKSTTGVAETDIGTILAGIETSSPSSWNDVIVADVTLAAGRYMIEARAGQGTGGVGPNYSGNKLGFGVKAGENAALANLSSYQALTIADGVLAGISTVKAVSPKNISVASNIQVPDGKTLTFDVGSEGSLVITGAISGAGSRVVLTGTGDTVMTFAGNSTYTGGTSVNVPKLILGNGNSFGSGGTTTFETKTDVTFETTLPVFTQPWQEYTIVQGSMNTADTPAEFLRKQEATYASTSPGKTTTRVYLSSALTTDEDVTLYFGKAYDDAAYIRVTDLTDTSLSKVVMNHSQWDDFGSGTFDFLKDHLYSIDLRVYNGDGGAGPTSGFSTTGEDYLQGMTPGVGVGVSTVGFTDGKGNDTFVKMNFDANGVFAGTPLRVSKAMLFDGAMVLNDAVSFDGTGTEYVVFNGAFSGPGALTLKNGEFTLVNTANTTGGLTLVNADYDLSKTLGKMTVNGNLSIQDSTLHVDLTNWNPSDEAFIKLTGTAEAANSELIFNMNGVTVEDSMTVTLFEDTDAAAPLPADFWQGFTFRIENSDLLGQLSSSANGLYLTFGTNAALPEPSAWVLLFAGLMGIGIMNRKQNKTL